MTTNSELDQISARIYNSNHIDVMISTEETEERPWRLDECCHTPAACRLAGPEHDELDALAYRM